MNFTVATVTGRLVALDAPTIDDINEIDIANNLSQINRYNGATRPECSWSVAAHSILAAYLAKDPDVYPYALVHDAHEAWCCDLISPLKKYLEHLVGRDVVKPMTDRFDKLISEYFGLQWPWPEHIARAVKRADMLSYSLEKKLFLAPTPEWSFQLPVPPEDVPGDILALAGRPDEAREWLLGALQDLRLRHMAEPALAAAM